MLLLDEDRERSHPGLNLESMTEIQPATPNPVWTRLMPAREVDRRVSLSWLSGLGFNRGAPVELLIQLLDVGVTDFLWREDLPNSVMDAVVGHRRRSVRALAAEIGRLSPAQWERIIDASHEPDLRQQLTERAEELVAARRLSRGGRGVGRAPRPDAEPPATTAEIATMASEVPDIDPHSSTTALWWIGALHANAEAMRQLARSPKLLVRRSVARAPRLPADVAELLASDEDRAVRLFLAESCDDAPPEMLLEVAGWWDASYSFPGRPRNHPNFPRQGLLRFAEDPNPRLRALALDDPASTAALVEQASHDSHEIVRMSAAEDPRLTPEAAVRLAADPDQGVRWRAASNPAVPPDELVALLLDLRTAQIAVRNPVLPASVMRSMVEVAAPWLDAPRHPPQR
ncbi:serine/threonine-protein kinase [Streptacidiphilus sp. PAMC 29251]